MTTLAIIADIHGCLESLEQTLQRLSGWQPDYYLLLGDLLHHGPRNPVPGGYAPLQVAERLNGLRERIIAVRGNCDSEVDQALLDFPAMAPLNQLLLAGRRCVMTHGHLFDVASLALAPGDLLISGHSHIAQLSESADGIILMNPGSITLPRGGTPASFGVYQDGELLLCRLADGAILARRRLGNEPDLRRCADPE